MVAFVLYDPAEHSPDGNYTVLSYGDCAPEDVISQGGSLAAMQVPEASLPTFHLAAETLENPPDTGGSWSGRMLVSAVSGQISFAIGSSTGPSVISEIEIRQIRDQLLADSDCTQLLDAPLTPSKQAEWAAYRQALRDMPGQPGSIIWPTKPT